MPKALAIETSGRLGSIALAEEGRVLAEAMFPHGLKHAAEIIPIIDRLCREQHWQPADLQELYVSAGPGSFTGLRIGITLAKTLAFATGVKLVAVPTVQVLVENAPAEAGHVIVVLDAKRDQIYTARFEREGEESDEATDFGELSRAERRSDEGKSGRASSLSVHWVEREPAHLDSLSAMLARSPRPVYLLGEGIPAHERFIPRDDPAIIIAPPDTWPARAAIVAHVGAALAQAGQFADPYHLTPIYIRPPEAEEKRLALENSSPPT